MKITIMEGTPEEISAINEIERRNTQQAATTENEFAKLLKYISAAKGEDKKKK